MSAYPFITVTRTANGYNIRGNRSLTLGYSDTTPDPDTPYAPHAHWHWDPESQSLHAHVDPMGFYNLFYYADQRRVMLSPSPLQLIARNAPSQLDHDALTVFYRLGLFLDNNTPFARIKTLPPAGVLQGQPGNLRITADRTLPTPQHLTYPQAIDAFIDLFQQSIRKCIEHTAHPLVLPLSGGEDSRHILLEMHRQNRPPDLCITVNGDPRHHDNETRAACNLTRALNVPHRIVKNTTSAPTHALRTLAATHLCSDEHAQLYPLADACNGQPWLMLDGIAGDVLSHSRLVDPHRMAACARNDFHTVADDLLANHARVLRHPLEHRLGAHAARTYPLDHAREQVAASLARCQDAAEPTTAFHFYNRTRREIALMSTGLLGRTAGILQPFLDPELRNLLLSLPHDAISDGLLHVHAIARAYPRFAHLPYARNLPPHRHARNPLAHRARAASQFLQALAHLEPALRNRYAPRLLRQSIQPRKPILNIHQLHRDLLELARSPDTAQRILDLAPGLGAPTTTKSPQPVLA